MIDYPKTCADSGAAKSSGAPMTDMEKAVSEINKTFAVYDNESYNLDNENDYICFSDIESREIIEVATSDEGTVRALFGDHYQKGKCYEVTQNRDLPCEFCSDQALSRDRFHVWQSRNEALGKEYLHKTKMVRLDDRFIRMDIAQDITDDGRKAELLAETLEGMSLWTECMGLLASGIPLEGALHVIIGTLGRFFQADSGFVVLYGSATYSAGWSRKGSYRVAPVFAAPTEAALSEWGALMKRNAHTLISDTADERIPLLLREHFGAAGIASTQLSPVFNEERLEGLICLNNVGKNKGQAFLVDMVAQSIANTLRQAELQGHLTRLRFRDPLTGGLNFEGFKHAAEKCIQENPCKKYSLWSADIRRFKYINDLFGFEVGDRFLQYWSDSLQKSSRDGDSFCRISADNFAVLCFFDDIDDLHDRFRRRDGLLGSCPVLAGKNFNPELVAGIYLLDDEDMRTPDINKMLDRANMAHKRVKALVGKQLAVYDEAMREQQVRELTISQHLEEGLAKGEFFVEVQPQVNFTTHEVVGAEVLVRWNHPTLGSISPGEFIPLLEKADLISKLDLFVWEEACGLVRTLIDQRGRQAVVPLSVNISRVDLYIPDLADLVSGLVEKYGITHDLLRLEITESAYTDDSKQLIAVVGELRDRGFSVEMDDFGSGYSSLNILKEVPVDVLKLDMRFLAMGEDTAGGVSNERGGSILSSIVRMAHWISLPVIAEGVETREQAEYLKSLGCYTMQGYYFAKPLPFNDFKEALTGARIGKMQRDDAHGDALRATEFLNTDGATSFLFTNCIGGACLTEFDGEELQALLLNDQFFDELGISRERCDACRTHMMSLCTPEDRESFIERFKDAVENGSSIAYMRPIRDDGGTRWVRGVNRYIATRDGKHLIFSVIEDVTNLRVPPEYLLHSSLMHKE
ncbi:MAG: EAL domain-containing protein [Eggerthellaceae bacterium]|nr:EAL domain-containing protein [Eggerthellaceae bacterium]